MPKTGSADGAAEKQGGPDGIMEFQRANVSRTHAEHVLRETEERLRVALEAAELGIWNLDTTTGLFTSDVRFRAIFGVSVEGLNEEQAIANIHPDDRDRIQDAVTAATRLDDPVPYEVEYRVVYADESIHWVLAKGRASFGNEESGRKLLSFAGTVADITGRKQAEATLRESEAFNRSIIESSPDCIKVLDLEGNLLSMLSGQELLGIEDIRPFLNKAWIDFWGGEDRLMAQAAVESAAAGTPGSFVGFYRTPSGQPKWWDVAISPILGANGRPERLLAVSRDVTRRKWAEINFGFLASISNDLVSLTNVDEMMRTVGTKMAAHLDLSLCAFVEIDEAADEVIINHDWHRQDVPSLVGVHRLADFVGEEFIQTARAGKMIVVRDTVTDTHTDPEKFAALKIAAFICVPLIRDGQWRFALCLYHSDLYDWREDEIELARELTARIWTRLERLRAEAALRDSQRFLRSSLDALSGHIAVLDESGKILEVNEAWRRFAVENQFPGAGYGIGTSYLQACEQTVASGIESPAYVDGIKDVIAGRRASFEMEYDCHSPTQLRWFVMRVTRFQSEGPVRIVIVHDNCTDRKVAENALRESEERYHTLFESIDDGFCIIEKVEGKAGEPLDFRYIQANPAFDVQSGMSDVVGKTIRQMFPGISEDWYLTYDSVLRTGEPIRFERGLLPAERVLELYVFRIGDDMHHRLAIIFKDVTQRKQAEDHLIQRTTQFQTLVNEAPLGIYLIDADFRIQQVNPLALPVFGNIPDLIGRNFGEVMNVLWPTARADELIQRFRHTLETGESYIVAEQIEERIDRNVTEYYEWQISRISLPDGRNGVVCYFRDISERILTQQKVLENEERYRDLFNSMDEGYCIFEMIFDEHGKPVDYLYLEVNPSFEKHNGLYSAVGKRVRELVPDLESSWFEIFGKVALTGEPVRFVNESKVLGRWFDLYAFRVGGRDSRKVAVLFTNITERKRYEFNLKNAIAVADKANLAKSDFLSSMSHELRTPLGAILGFAQLMESGSPLPTTSQKRSIDQILKAGWYLLDLINEILDLAVIESGKPSLSLEPVSLDDVMHECQSMVELQALKHRIKVAFPQFKVPYVVHADRIRLKQVLINLLSNAIKYNKVDGTVVMNCIASTPGRIRIRVEDTGEGLTADRLTQLFQPFNRLGQELGVEEGTGIGLVVSKRLVELMGGEIGVESAVGKGSVFWIELNLTAELQLGTDPSELTAIAHARVPADVQLHTLLYVEDNPANLMLIEELLARRPDIRLLSAKDGNGAIEMARAARPDVILMDIHLPDISGFKAVSILTDDPATAHIPVIALSAYARPHDIQKGLQAGFFRYLTKPIKIPEFMDTLDRALIVAKTQSASAITQEKT